MPNPPPTSERVSGILVGMVREMTLANRDLAHQVGELRTDLRTKWSVLDRVETRLEADAKAEAERVSTTSALYKFSQAMLKLPGIPLLTVALALWIAKLLGVIEFLPHRGTP